MLSSPVRYIAGRRTGDGYVQFDTEKWTLEALKRLQEAKKTLKFDVWHSQASNEAPLLSLIDSSFPPNNPRESPGYPKIDEQGIPVQQLFIGSLPNWLSEHELHNRLMRMFEPFGEIKWLRIGEISTTVHVFLV